MNGCSCGPATGATGDAVTRRCAGILLPGLVNVHAHSPMTVLRGMDGDLPEQVVDRGEPTRVDRLLG